ncbi:MAG TPA: gfo/Idh/MocA family oxidoreductase, partial [Candidatus Avimonas sp.]|nr:gfo/Idh/MocA family oxidoreductase [Candidatus Avimonas sp.]
GDKAGIRLTYGADFEVFTAENGALVSYKPDFNMTNHFENEINGFIRSIQTGEKLPSDIDTVIITQKIMQAIYDSAETHREIVF